MAQGRRKKGRQFIGIGGDSRLASKSSVLEVRGFDGMAGASPAEKRGGVRRRKRPPARTLETVAGYNTDAEKFDKMREKQRKSDLKRIREIKRRQKAQAQLEKGKQGKTGRGVADRAASTGQGRYSAVIGMGPSQITTGGGLGMLTQQDRSKPKKMNMGGVMKARGGTFKGVF